MAEEGHEFTEFAPLDGSALARWAVDYVAGQDGKLSVANATYLMQRVGTNQQLLAHELDKLVVHGADITRDTIDLLTEAAPQSSIFELLDAAFAGRRQRCWICMRSSRPKSGAAATDCHVGLAVAYLGADCYSGV